MRENKYKRQKSSLADKVSKQFFAERFREAMNLYKKENEGKTQQDFANAVPVDKNSISAYMTGKHLPDDYNFPLIIKAFKSNIKSVDIDEAFFLPQSHHDLYTQSVEYMNTVIQEHAKIMEEINLSESFLWFMRVNTNFSEEYPTHAPLRCSLSEKAYFRPTNRVPVPDDLPYNPFTITEGEKTTLLNHADLYILKDIQEEVIEFIRYLFYKRQIAMEHEEKEATKRFLEHFPHELSRQDLISIDKYMNYYKRQTK